MTSEGVRCIEKYIKENDKRRAIRYTFTCEHRSGKMSFGTVMVYIFVCHGPIIGRTDDLIEAIELINTCLEISR